MKQRLIYSVGHSSRSIEDFLALLAAHDLERLVDVRRFSVSRRHPQFSREAFRDSLRLAGIDYQHLGEELGGYTKTPYREYIRTETFQRGFRELERVAAEKPTSFLCAEKLPWQCHRRFIAQELGTRGWEVIHILDRDTVWNADQPFLLQHRG
jgi:uncharacterized protein (DUF488 family)